MKVFLIINEKSGGVAGAFKKKAKAEKYLNGTGGFIVKKIKVEK